MQKGVQYIMIYEMSEKLHTYKTHNCYTSVIYVKKKYVRINQNIHQKI